MMLKRISPLVRMSVLLGLFAGLSIPFSPSKATPSAGAVITVNTYVDEMSKNGNCSLREAIQAANTDAPVDQCAAGSGFDTVLLPEGTFAISILGKDEDANLAGDLDILSDMVITGQGISDTIIDGAGIDRVFHVLGQITVKFNRLTIQNGNDTNTSDLYGGGGILIEDPHAATTIDRVQFSHNHSNNNGGGIDCAGETTVTNSIFKQNSAASGGGAIWNVGTLNLLSSAVLTNTTTLNGGGLNNRMTAYVTNVTFTGNQANEGGGAIASTILLMIKNVTIAGNSSGINKIGGQVYVRNTILANSSSGENCTPAGAGFSSNGFNLDDGSSCGFSTQGGDLSNANPLLGPLVSDNSPTPYFSLLPGSPAVDPAGNTECITTDQRGKLRPGDGDQDGTYTCDMGSFELNGREPILLFLPAIDIR